MTDDWVYHHFSPLDFAAIDRLFIRYDRDYRLKIYDAWLSHFEGCSHNFYLSQIRMHEEWLDFRVERGLLDEEGARQQLETHQERFDLAIWEIESLTKWYFPDRSWVISMSEALENLAFWVRSDRPAPDWWCFFLDAYWFDCQFPQAQPELRSMAYPEYLKSAHWRKVRAAMLLIRGSRCTSKYCRGLDTYRFGDEKYLHVHHTNYQHRGQERFADLRLICDRCHARLHEQGDDIFEDVLTKMYKQIGRIVYSEKLT